MTTIKVRLKNAFEKTRFAKSESAVRQVSFVAGGTVIAQAIGILTIPIISRVYSPADYGIMAVYTSVIAILGELSGLRYYLAIPLSQNERYANALVFLSLGVQIAFVSLLGFLLFFAGEYLLTKFSVPVLIPFRALIPLGLLATGSYLTLTQWAIREKLFSTIARTKITQSLSGALAKVALGLLGIRPLGLLIGAIIAQGGGITTLLRSLLKKKGIPCFQRNDVRRVALRYRNFPIFSTLSGILITTGGKVPNLLLATLYSTQISGLFTMAQQLLNLPSTFIGQAIGQVFFQRASVAKRENRLPIIFTKTYCLLMRASFFPIILFSFWAPDLFSMFLGESWHQAGIFALVTVPGVLLQFIYSPLSTLYAVLERQNIGLYFEFIHLPLRVLALYLGARLGNEITSVLFFTIVNFLIYFAKIAYLNYAIGHNFFSLCKNFFREASIAMSLLCLSAFFVYIQVNVFFFFLSLALSLLIYCVLIFKSI